MKMLPPSPMRDACGQDSGRRREDLEPVRLGEPTPLCGARNASGAEHPGNDASDEP